MKKASLLLLIAASALSSAHYTFPNLIINNQKTGYYQYTRMAKGHYSHAAVTDVTSKDMRCGGEDPFPSNASIAAITAGSTVGFAAEPNVQHVGPLMFYMARVPEGKDVGAWDGSGQVWFKISADHPDIIPKGLKFPSEGSKSVTTKLPTSLPSGNYLLRVEHIALHGASQENGAQIYIQCAQLKVTGGGNGVPSPKVSFPGAYSKTDPGIKFQLYWPQPTSYVNPGPPVWSG